MLHFGTSTTNPVHRAIFDEIQGLDQLAGDLTVINTAPFPMERIVDTLCTKAPILQDWRFAMRAVPCLVGNSFGHPILEGDGRHIVTSEVFLFSEELSCARTYSRWYRLGRPFDDGAEGG